jgi:4-hydroxy-3-methylbut-2-en-1-yl diphosphate synthase IspG/GcpE
MIYDSDIIRKIIDQAIKKGALRGIITCDIVKCFLPIEQKNTKDIIILSALHRLAIANKVNLKKGVFSTKQSIA